MKTIQIASLRTLWQLRRPSISTLRHVSIRRSQPSATRHLTSSFALSSPASKVTGTSELSQRDETALRSNLTSWGSSKTRFRRRFSYERNTASWHDSWPNTRLSTSHLTTTRRKRRRRMLTRMTTVRRTKLTHLAIRHQCLIPMTVTNGKFMMNKQTRSSQG